MGVKRLDSRVVGFEWKKEPGEVLIDEKEWSAIGTFLGLSDRETAVCQLLFLGQTRVKIAEGIQVSPRTVRHYMEHIHTKLNVCNRVSLVLRIVQARDHLLSRPPIPNSIEKQISDFSTSIPTASNPTAYGNPSFPPIPTTQPSSFAPKTHLNANPVDSTKDEASANAGQRNS